MNVEHMDLVARMREGRQSPAALKIALSHIRSAKPAVIVFVFEGLDDVGPYQVWVARCRARPEYEPLPGKGKDQLLAFRQMLSADTTGIKDRVFFFIDHDFDGLKGMPPGPDVYVHDAYSAENHLVCEEVLDSLLIDELRCAGAPLVRESVLESFRSVRQKFHAHVRSLNFRLFLATRIGIKVLNLETSISSFVSIALAEVTLVEGVSVNDFLRLSREPTSEEELRFASDFDALIPSRYYRGKFEIQMFVKWITRLAEDRCSLAPKFFSERAKIGNMQGALTLRSLATRCALPSGFEEFVAAAA